MKRAIVVVSVAVLFPFFANAASAQSLQGAWRTVEVVIGGGPDEGRHTEVQANLALFTESHYANLWVIGWEPRPLSHPSDEEYLAVVRAFGANAGTYEFDGSTVVLTPAVAKIPAVMTDNSFTDRIEWVNDDELWFIQTTEEGWQNRYRSIRVGN